MTTWRIFRRNRGAVAGLFVLALLAIVALAGPILAPYDATQPNMNALLSPPDIQHLLGTDQIGRDMLSRIIVGAPYSLRTALIALAVASGIGLPLGLLAGYFSGWVGGVIDMFTDAMLAFPGILLALAIVTALGPGFTNGMIAVGVSFSPIYIRLVRGQVLATKATTYVEAARVVGCTDLRILFRHILPNILAPIIVLTSMGMAGAILAGAGLSYLGLGAAPPTPEWGALMNAGAPFLSSAPWLTLYPGLAILVVVLAANLLGDGLRDAFDPRQRTSIAISTESKPGHRKRPSVRLSGDKEKVTV